MSGVTNYISKFYTNPLGGAPQFRAPKTPISRKTRKYGLKHALHTLDGQFFWITISKK